MTTLTLATAWQQGAASSGGRFLRVSDVMTTLGLGRSTIYRMVADGTFPAQVKLTAQCSGWWQADVDTWMREKLAASPLRC
jgi:prophage regulatory protein